MTHGLQIPLHVVYDTGKRLATPVCLANVHERGHDADLQTGGDGQPLRGAKPPHRRTLTIAERFSPGKSLELHADNRSVYPPV